MTERKKNKSYLFLLCISLLFFFLRFPSLFEPNWYGDEGIYQVIGRALHSGRVLYSGIWDNKPPLLYIYYAVFNGDQFALRCLSLVFGVGAIVVFYKLAKILFPLSNDEIPQKKSENVVLISTLLFSILFGLPLLEGNIANAENFMLFPILLAGFILYSKRHIFTHDGSNYKIAKRPFLSFFLVGFLLGLSFLTKIVAVFDTAAFFLFLCIRNVKSISSFFPFIKKVLPFIIGFVLPLAVTFAYFFLKGAVVDFLKASLFQNVGYVGYGNSFIIPQGLLILKLTLLLCFVFFLFFKREQISDSYIFILLWGAFSLFNAFFSQRPYTHYVLVLLPSLCLLIAEALWKKPLRIYNLLLISIVLFLVLRGFTFYGKTIFYYQNFTSFLFGNKTVTSYQAFFDQATPRDYALAEYIQMHRGNGLYIWGDNAQVYVLTHTLPPGRYTVAYHVLGYKNGADETRTAIVNAKPQFFIIMPNLSQPPFTLTNYDLKIRIAGAFVYEKIF